MSAAKHEVGAAGTAKMDCGCGFYRQNGNLVVARCAIHEASSELLSTLKVLIRMVENVLTDSQLDHPNCGRIVREALFAARAAIAKAEGREA